MRATFLALLFFFSTLQVQAYLPATPASPSSAALQGQPVDMTVTTGSDVTKLPLRQLVSAAASRSNGTANTISGSIIHFTEDLASKPLYVTDLEVLPPWVALIDCNLNSTAATSTAVDAFTAAYIKGAQAAVLYSSSAASCVLGADYLAQPEPILDVYTTTAASDAASLEAALQAHTEPDFYAFNSSTYHSPSSSERLVSVSLPRLNVSTAAGGVAAEQALSSSSLARAGLASRGTAVWTVGAASLALGLLALM